MSQHRVSRARECKWCGLKMRCTAEEIENHARTQCPRRKKKAA